MSVWVNHSHLLLNRFYICSTWKCWPCWRGWIYFAWVWAWLWCRASWSLLVVQWPRGFGRGLAAVLSRVLRKCLKVLIPHGFAGLIHNSSPASVLSVMLLELESRLRVLSSWSVTKPAALQEEAVRLQCFTPPWVWSLPALRHVAFSVTCCTCYGNKWCTTDKLMSMSVQRTRECFCVCRLLADCLVCTSACVCTRLCVHAAPHVQLI